MIEAINSGLNFKGDGSNKDKNVTVVKFVAPPPPRPDRAKCDEYIKNKSELKRKTGIAYSIAAGAVAISTATILGYRRIANNYVKLIKEFPAKTFLGNLKQLGDAASIDAMTKLGNKQNLNVNVIRDYKRAMKHGKNFNIGMLDMDNFKSINEIEGHPTGDFFLTRIAEDAKKVADRHNAKSYRYGGEEFVITSIGKTKEEMQSIMNEISSAIKNDDKLQNLMPTFMKDLDNQLNPVEKHLSSFQKNIFEKLKGNVTPKEDCILRKEIKNFLKYYEEDPIDGKAIKEIMNAMDDKNFVLKPDSIIGSTPLQVHLDRLIAPSKETRNDLLKWKNHAQRYNAFTISGGYATLTPANARKSVFDTSKKLVDVADVSLKSAKLNGKNTMVEATEDIIKQIN